jgi:FAD/FMN-containing dehydrogenase
MSSNHLPWLAKSGGHGYSPTLQVIQDAVLINLEKFNYVRVEDDGTLVVGTGTFFQDLVDEVAAAGRELSKSFQLQILCAHANVYTAVGACGCVVSTNSVLILLFQVA